MINMPEIQPQGMPPIQGGDPSTWSPQGQQEYMPEDPSQDYPMQAPQPFPFPGAWGQAGDIYGSVGQGAPFSTGQWNVGAGALANLANTGLATDVSGLEEKYAPIMQRTMDDLVKQEAEKRGMTGTRDSSMFNRAMTEFGSNIAENFAMKMANANIQAQEAARQRQLAALGQLGQRGGMDLGAQQAARQMQLGAGRGLANLGQQQLYAPMNIAQGMMGMGGQMQGLQQQEINAAMNDPYLQMAMQMSGMMPNQYMPEQYKPGWASQLMNIGGSLAPFAFGGGGNTSSELVNTPMPAPRNIPY